ncbi:hypothetical protein ACLOJK_028626 [Asimina triloba]
MDWGVNRSEGDDLRVHKVNEGSIPNPRCNPEAIRTLGDQSEALEDMEFTVKPEHVETMVVLRSGRITLENQEKASTVETYAPEPAPPSVSEKSIARKVLINALTDKNIRLSYLVENHECVEIITFTDKRSALRRHRPQSTTICHWRTNRRADQLDLVRHWISCQHPPDQVIEGDRPISYHATELHLIRRDDIERRIFANNEPFTTAEVFYSDA